MKTVRETLRKVSTSIETSTGPTEVQLTESVALVPEKNPEDLTKFRRLFVVVLCLITITLEGINISMPGPFFPREAKNKGLSQTQIGLVVGAFDILNLCCSFVVATLVSPKNIKFFFVTGTLWSSLTVASFGLLSESPSGDAFFYSCLFTRMMNGAAAAMLYKYDTLSKNNDCQPSCTAIPVAVQMYPGKAALITTGVQICAGCGLCFGPPLGSLLLPIGGYKCPFLVTGTTEFVIFAFSFFVIPSNRVQTNSKFRSSDYLRYLFHWTALSEIIPLATLLCIPAIRDTAYALYLENVLGVEHTKVGYIFMLNSADVFISGPIFGFLVEIGFGSIIAVVAQGFTLLMAFALFLPYLVPQLETVAWCAMILACNGFTVSSTMNPGFLIMEKIAIRQGFTNLQQIKTISASSFNLALSIGRTFGAFVIGGYINDVMGFYNMCLFYVIMLSVTATWNVVFLFRFGLVGRLYYDSKLEVTEANGIPKEKQLPSGGSESFDEEAAKLLEENNHHQTGS